jgi:hypothetical protein
VWSSPSRKREADWRSPKLKNINTKKFCKSAYYRLP